MEQIAALIVGIACLFKGEVKALFARISQLKYKDVEANFEKGLAEAEAEAQKVRQVSPPAPPKAERISHLDQLRRIAEVSPRAAIMEAWVLIETAAAASGFSSGVSIPRVNPRTLAEYLAHSGQIPEESIALVGKLRQLRNQAAHLPEFVLSQDEAERYLELAVKISEIIGSSGSP